MSKLVLITFTLSLSFGINAQTKIIEGSTLLPSKKDGAIVVLPNNLNNQKAQPKQFNKLGKEIKVPQSIYRSVTAVTTSSKNTKPLYGSTIILPKGLQPSKVEPINSQQQAPQSFPVASNTELSTNWLAPAQPSQINEVVDNVGGVSDDVPSLLTPVLKKYEQPKSNVVKETLDPKKVYPGALAKQSLGLPPTTKSSTSNTGDLAPIDPQDLSAYNANKNKTAVVSNTTMIDLAPVDVAPSNLTNTIPTSANSKQSIGMPDLVPINERGNTVPTKVNSGMIDLPPIEGGSTTTVTKQSFGMPDLAPIENDGNTTQNLADINNSKNNQVSNKISTAEKGLELPKGTILASQLGLSYIVKPSVPRQIIDSFRNRENEVQSFRPKAGGGLSMIDLAPIERDATINANKNTRMIDLAPIESSVVSSNQTSMVELAPIEANYQVPSENNVVGQYQAPTAPIYYQQQPKRAYVKTSAPRKKWKPNPCPCAVPKRKWYPPKKRTYSYTKPAIQQPATVIKYIDRPRETIVYVPVQQQQQQQPQQQVENKQPAQQEQPKDKFVYTDYTNTYKKTETFNKACNCNQQQQTSTAAPKDPAQYYNPNNYVGMNAGPTSGDYAVNPSSNKNPSAPMQYAFYVNKKGEYSVSVFNSYASVLLQQNGKIIEYKINDQQTSTNTPKYNYFGAAESIGGIPIEYNYNRSVNRIGDVQFTYDFEGFIKTIGNSTVLYNSRSRISQVDNIFINYNGTEAVNVSPANTGKVYLSR